MLRHLADVTALHIASVRRWVRLLDLTQGLGRWRRRGKCRAPDPHWTRHRSGF